MNAECEDRVGGLSRAGHAGAGPPWRPVMSRHGRHAGVLLHRIAATGAEMPHEADADRHRHVDCAAAVGGQLGCGAPSAATAAGHRPPRGTPGPPPSASRAGRRAEDQRLQHQAVGIAARFRRKPARGRDDGHHLRGRNRGRRNCGSAGASGTMPTSTSRRSTAAAWCRGTRVPAGQPDPLARRGGRLGIVSNTSGAAVDRAGIDRVPPHPPGARPPVSGAAPGHGRSPAP